jgi:hypothetical protein
MTFHLVFQSHYFTTQAEVNMILNFLNAEQFKEIIKTFYNGYKYQTGTGLKSLKTGYNTYSL